MIKKETWLYNRKNNWLILISVGLIITGFILMKGTGNYNESAFNPAIYSFRRITIAPVLLLAGYLNMVYALLAVPEKNNPNG